MPQVKTGKIPIDDHVFSEPAYWDKLIKSYEDQARGNSFPAHFAAAALARLNVGPGQRVLDIATGVGTAARLAAKAGAEVLAIDFSAAMIERVRSLRMQNLEALQMDGQALDLRDGSFDVVLSIFGVMLFENWRAGLREMARVTRRGGAAAIAVWQDQDGAATHLLLTKVRKALFPGLPPPSVADGIEKLSDANVLAEEMIAAGFEAPRIEAITHPFSLELSVLDDAERLFEPILPWRTLDGDQRRAVLAELRRRAEFGRVGDHLPIPSTAWLATARRS